MIRKSILEDVMKQLNEQLSINEKIKSEYEEMKNRYIAKENESRNKQMEYIDKIE